MQQSHIFAPTIYPQYSSSLLWWWGIIQLSQYTNSNQHVEENTVWILPRDKECQYNCRPWCFGRIGYFLASRGLCFLLRHIAFAGNLFTFHTTALRNTFLWGWAPICVVNVQSTYSTNVIVILECSFARTIFLLCCITLKRRGYLCCGGRCSVRGRRHKRKCLNLQC